MAADKRKPDIPEEVIESLARAILPSIQKYFESEEGQREIRRVESKENESASGSGYC
jgi:septum formation topological specificity factor MinE